MFGIFKFQVINNGGSWKADHQVQTTSCNLDPIPTDLVKKCMDVLLNPISDIVNSSLQEGSFPDSWKCAIVTPHIKKKGIDLAYKSYKPVSNLPFLSKVIEKAGLNQYVDHVECINKFSTKNSAYKKHHSTDTLLIKIHSDLINNMDNQNVILLVLLDLSAASTGLISNSLKYGVPQGSCAGPAAFLLNPRCNF